MEIYNKKKLDTKVEDLPFQDYFTTRYSITVRVKAQKTYDYAKKNGIPFFNLTVACIIETINDIPEFKKRMINNSIYEYDKINALTPILLEIKTIKEIEIKPISEYLSFDEWNKDFQNKKKDNIYQYTIGPSQREELPVFILSCMPWINFDSMTNVIPKAHQIMPAIFYGKLVDGKIPVLLSVNNNFIFGYQLKLFFEDLEKYLENPEIIIKKYNNK